MRTESKAIAFRIGLSGPSEGKQGLQGRMHCLGAGVLLSSPRSCSCMQGVARLPPATHWAKLWPSTRNRTLQPRRSDFRVGLKRHCGLVFWQLIHVRTRINSSEEHKN